MTDRDTDQIETQVGTAIFRARRRLILGLRSIIHGFNVTGAQYRVLKDLDKAGQNGLSQIELSRRIPTSKPNVTGLLKRLEAANLIEREAGETDARVKRVRLTTRGRALLEQMKGPVEAASREMADGLTESEKKDLIDLLSRVAPSAPPKDEPGPPA